MNQEYSYDSLNKSKVQKPLIYMDNFPWLLTILISLLLIIVLFASCSFDSEKESKNSREEETFDSTKTSDTTAENWSDATHSKEVDPNYDIVFNQSEVMVLDIVIKKEDWGKMQADLAKDDWATMQANMGGRGGISTIFYYDPIWVESSITYEGITWDHVGIRYKGNSSLLIPYRSGNRKLSFKLDFDEFEDDYPEINNQRFYGFKQLNLSNNFFDQSLMREKIAADLFREFGLVASETAFCVLNVDYGKGSQFYGVYTLIEEMDNTTIKTQTGDDSGNLYKPEGDAATFASGTYDEDEMEKKNNDDEADYSDVAALYEVINKRTRTTDTESWKSDLEEVLNVDGYLKWLAANIVIQNWDTYGIMPHNFYLYNDPNSNQLNWIPWDNNTAFGTIGIDNRSPLPLDLSGVSGEWPLISYIIVIPEYKGIYNAYVQEFVDEVFTMEAMTATYDTYYELLKEYAYAEGVGYTSLSSDAEFDKAVETLKSHVEQRKEAVDSYLGN